VHGYEAPQVERLTTHRLGLLAHDFAILPTKPARRPEFDVAEFPVTFSHPLRYEVSRPLGCRRPIELSYTRKTNMKTIALIAAVLIGSSFVVEPATASAGNTSRWIQMGISAANTARQVSKARNGNNGASAYGQNNNNSGGLLPKLLKRRSY